MNQTLRNFVDGNSLILTQLLKKIAKKGQEGMTYIYIPISWDSPRRRRVMSKRITEGSVLGKGRGGSYLYEAALLRA